MTKSLRVVLSEVESILEGFEENPARSVASKIWQARMKRWGPALASALARLEAAEQRNRERYVVPCESCERNLIGADYRGRIHRTEDDCYLCDEDWAALAREETPHD